MWVCPYLPSGYRSIHEDGSKPWHKHLCECVVGEQRVLEGCKQDLCPLRAAEEARVAAEVLKELRGSSEHCLRGMTI